MTITLQPGERVEITKVGADGAKTTIDTIEPAAPTPAPEPDPDPVPVPVPASLPLIGLVGSGAWAERMDQAFAATGAKLVRLDWQGSQRWKADWATAAFATARKRGARVILLVSDTAIAPSTVVAFAKTWLRPGDIIELGNETGYSSTDQAVLTSLAKTYAQRTKALVDALKAAGLSYGVIAQADPAMRGSAWIDGMFAAVPDLHTRVAGFTVHPYGPAEPTTNPNRDGYLARLATMQRQLGAHGVPADVPVWITEYGISTDNGRTLDNNYGWPLSLTYSRAGELLVGAIRDFGKVPQNVVAVTVFQDVDQANSGALSGRESYFGVIRRSDGSPKVGVADALAKLIAEAGQ